MVFNDEEIAKHFEIKIWVCVSDEFDIKLVIKDILEEKAEACLEELQKKVRDKLSGKRYLIVLDDVWNEKVEAWDDLRSVLDCGSNGAFVLTTTRKRIVAEITGTIQHLELSSLSNVDCWLLFEERAFKHGKPKSPNFIKIGKKIVEKCKGVPLVAKTLGSQLGFKSNEKEWCRIRDSKNWEIFQNFNVLPILRLSYYDLPYHLRRCFVFCAIFPKDIKIEKDGLIQLWMAHGLVPTLKNEEVEDVGNTIWEELCWRSFFQDNKLDSSGLFETCKMHDLMHDLAQSVMKYECYTLDANSSSDGLRCEIRHLIVKDDQLVKTSIPSFKKNGGLQSIMIDDTSSFGNINVTKEILSVLKELPSLRVLEISRTVQYQDLCDVECLKHLRYLSISIDDMTTLPNSICDLLNLQTLKLNKCYKLESLPRNLKDLINLRHLYLEGCHGLKYMPRGMKQLKHLKTLSLFVIGNKEKDCQLDELKELDIGGSLKIKNLGRVSDACIARGISMSKKSSINKLKLEWTSVDEDDDNQNKSTRHEKISEALEVSSERLKILKMSGYKGVNLPKWMGKSYPSLTRLELWGLENVNAIAIGSSRDDNEMMVIFPLLEELVIDGMKNLRELVSPSPGAFPNLCTLWIYDCPKLGRLPPHLKALKDVIVEGECWDELLYSICNLHGTLTRLSLNRLNNDVEQIFSVNNMNRIGIEVVLFPLLEYLSIGRMKNLRELVSPTIPSPGAFPNVTKMHIYNCPNLRALPPHLKDVSVTGECWDELLDSISNLSALTHLTLFNMNERSVLFPAPSSSTFQSLQSLSIQRCNKLRRLFDEGMIMEEETLNISGCQCQNQQNHHLQGLTKLDIWDCPELMISLEEFGNLNINNSLQSLWIEGCPKLVSSEEADDFMALLRSLRTRLIGPLKFHVDILWE